MEGDDFRLRMILVEVQRMSDRHWGQLDGPVRSMDGKAWVGPSARAFERELRRNRRALQEQLEKAVDLLRQPGSGRESGVVL
ncbi:hypothetical protein [Actinocorallia populi]|uniref:hypothetical protein n=1 Tax=Actinocorallia populi TaxID=2079200 RepID=UPI000D08EBBB|nr:hypothetical protein [Actinocorallia populi]